MYWSSLSSGATNRARLPSFDDAALPIELLIVENLASLMGLLVGKQRCPAT